MKFTIQLCNLCSGKATVIVYSGGNPSNPLSFSYMDENGQVDDTLIDLPADSSDIMFDADGYVIMQCSG